MGDFRLDAASGKASDFYLMDDPEKASCFEALVENGEGVAAFVCDGIFDSQGALVTPN